MGTLLKYLLYAFIIIVIYLLGVGFYEGTINKDSTVGEVTDDVAKGTKRIIRDGYESTKDVIKDGYNSTKDAVKSEKGQSNPQEGGFRDNGAAGGFQEAALSTGKGKTAAGSYKSAENTISEGYENTRENVKDGYRRAKENVKEGYHSGKEKVKDGYKAAKDKNRDGYEAVKDKVRDGYKNPEARGSASAGYAAE